jgi:DNA-binding transcriptional ArsR family regulator
MAIAHVQGTAGEGDARPCTSIEDARVLSTDDVNLPWVILRAIHRAAQIDGVPARARAVLAALARTVDAKKPFAEIFARRNLLSERAMQSERTFYRSLTDLENAGLIERPGQRRYVEAGLFGRAYLHLTQIAAELLGLVEPPAPPADPFDLPSDSVADGANTKDLSPTSLQKRQPGEFSTQKPGQPPEDLQRLRSLGFADFLIFKLMREAREAGKRLSDVVEACWPSLRKATYPISYLKKLIGSTVDFGHQVRTRRSAQIAAQEAADAMRVAEREIAELDGKTFVDISGAQRYVVGDGELTVYRSGENVARRVGGEWKIQFVQLLKRGQIIKNAVVPVQVPEAAALPLEVPRELTPIVVDHLGALRRFCGVRVKHT